MMNDVLSISTYDNVSLSDGRFSSGRGVEGEIATVLGWAVKRNIPFHEALATISCKIPGTKGDIRVLFSSSYKTQVILATAELEKGKALSFVLKKCLSKYLSPYYLAAVEKAEKENKLAEILPRLAENIRFVSDIREQFKAALTYPVVLFTNASLILLGLYVFIIPKFGRIFEELADGTPLPRLLTLLTSFAHFLTSSFFHVIAMVIFTILFAPMMLSNSLHIDTKSGWIFIFFIIFQILYIVIIPYICLRFLFKSFKSVMRYPMDLVSSFILHIPFIGKQKVRMALLELSAAMASLTGAGYDVLDAAKWNSDTVSGRWLRKRLIGFVESVEKGKYWADAWEDMHLGSPTHNWIIRNAASRENPYEGFRMLSEWLDNEIKCQNSISLKYLEILSIFFNATLIAITIFAIWQCLWALIYYSANF